uniref:Uncharacterized protein n=1 Tax=Romanomermis culicivorax TaxID=13658 RepID=A0A915HTD4_ROMCU
MIINIKEYNLDPMDIQKEDNNVMTLIILLNLIDKKISEPAKKEHNVVGIQNSDLTSAPIVTFLDKMREYIDQLEQQNPESSV